MKATFLIVLSTLLLSAITSGQKKLTKDEIIGYWTKNKTENSTNKNALQIIGLDTVLYTRTFKLIDSLHTQNIDSVVIYSVAYPGYYGAGKCQTGLYPVNSFVIWKSFNEVSAQRLEGKCNSSTTKINATGIFNYYDKNFTGIRNEYFMPIIFSAELSDSNHVKYSMSFIDHEPNYSIVYMVGKSFKEIEFSESELKDKKSLFHDHNLSLKSYAWWEIIKRDLKQ